MREGLYSGLPGLKYREFCVYCISCLHSASWLYNLCKAPFLDSSKSPNVILPNRLFANTNSYSSLILLIAKMA